MLSDNLVNKYEIKELRDLVNTTVKSEIKSDIKVIDENFIRRAYQKEYNFHKLFESLNDQGFKNDYGEVCDDWAAGEEGDKICAPYHTFMRGVIGALIDFSEGNGEILIEYTKEIKEAVYLGAVGSKDIEPLRAGLIEGSKVKLESCSVRKPNYKDEDECEKGLSGLLILGVLWENEKGAKENANVIYKALKGNMKKAYGPLVISEGIAALSYMDTDYSYSLIEKFLTEDSMPGKVGEGITRTLDLLSLSGIYDTWEAVISKAHKGGIRYLNRNNENWQYILEEETRKAGIDPVAIAKQNEEAMKWDKRYAETSYKVVYGNVLTDIGEFLAQSNERGKKLSNKIISSYVYDNKVVHLPLILGLIKGKNAAFDVKVGLAARRLNEGFYYDLNGGTGRYVAVNSALKGSGLTWKRQNVVSYEYYNTKVGISRVNFIGDMFINVVMSGMLVLSIPSIMKSIYNLGRLAKLSVRYGGKNVARMGRIVKGSEKAAAEAAKQAGQAKVQPEPKTKAAPKAEPKGQTKAGTTSTEWKPSTVQVMNKTEGATEVGSYNTSTGAVTDVTKAKPSQVKTATIGEGGSGASAEDALNGIRARTKRLRTSRNVNREVKELEIETAKAQAEPAKAKNIFNKPYSQMNGVEKKIFDTYIRLELGGLGDLKAAIKDSKSLLTTRTGIKNTAASGLAFGTGEAPAVEARMLAKAPTEVVVNAEKGNIFNNPITLFDRAGLNSQIGSSGRAVSHFPNTFKVSTPKVKSNLFNGFKLFPNYMGLARQQKLNNVRQTATIGGITAIASLMATGVINPITAVGMSGLLMTANALAPSLISNQNYSLQGLKNSIFKGKKSNARSDTAAEDKNKLTLQQARLLNIAKKAPLIAILYSFMVTGFGDFVSPAVALAQDTFNISPFEASLLSLSGYLMFLFSVPISNLQTKIGKTNVMKIGATLATAGAALPMFFGMYGNYNPQTANINQFYAMAASIALVCLGTTMLETGATSLFADVSKDNESITPNLVVGDAIRCLPMALGFVAPALLSSIGLDWTALYPLYTAFFASTLGVLLKTKIAEAKHETSSLKDTFGLLKNKDIALLVAAAFAYIGAEIPLLSMTPIMFTEQGFPVETAEIMGFLTTMLPIILSNFIAPPLIKRFGENKVLMTSLMSALTGLSLVFTPIQTMKYIGLILAGLGYGNIYPLLLGKAQQKDVSKVDGIMGLMLTSTVGAAFMTPLAAAFANLTNTTLSYLIPVTAVAFILGVVLRDNYQATQAPQQTEPGKITIEYLEQKYGYLIYPRKAEKETSQQIDEAEIEKTNKTIPLRQQALDWGMAEDVDRSTIESIAWTLGIPQQRIYETSKYALWLLVCLYSWMQLGNPINRVYDDNLASLSKANPNITEMFNAESNKPDFVYVFDEETNSFQVISLKDKDRDATVGGLIDAPFVAPWNNAEYVENVIIAGKSIPVFKLKNSAGKDLEITDTNHDSPIIKYAAKYDDPNVTVEQILNDPIFHPYHATDGNIYNYSAILQMIRKSERNLSSTSDEFRAFGEKEKAIYRPERQELHDQIIDKIFGDYESKVSEHPTFILLGGRGGSGKSKFEGKVYDTKHYLLLDSDAIKAMLPEYEGYNSNALHNESRDLLDRILRLSIEKKVNVVLDATMSGFGTLKNRLQMFKDAGYRTEAHYMFVPRQETGKRALMRFLNNPDGRYVPIQVALNMRNNEKNFDAIKDFVDGWTFNDNNVPYGAPPKLIAKHGIFSYGNAGKTWEEVLSPDIVEQKNINKFLSKLPSWVLPAVGVGLLAFSAFNGLGTSGLALAALPLWASKLSVLQPNSPRDKFFNLHKRFVPNIFSGYELSEDAAMHMKEILGEESFNLWQKYYNKDLNQIAQENPQDLEELIKYSGRYETSLTSRIDKIYGGTNPLYVFASRNITNNFINNLLGGQTMETAIENLGKDMAAYHRKVAQIMMLQMHLSPTWKFGPDWEDFNNDDRLSQVSHADMWAGKFRISSYPINNKVAKDSYGEYLDDMLNSSSNRAKTYKGIELSTISKYPEIRFASIDHPNFGKQKDIFFKVLQEDYDNIKPLIDKVQQGGQLTKAERKILDDNIADISYIFTNVMPFWRGSASINLVIVYGLYEMAGIDAPAIKIGRSLDLSAFASTPKEYKKNWQSLFDGDFVFQGSKKNNTGGLSSSMFRYFHRLTKDPWLEDISRLPQDALGESSLEDLARKAEEYGMLHERALEIIAGYPEKEARRQLQNFITFNKEGERVAKEKEQEKEQEESSTTKAQDKSHFSFVKDNYILGKYKAQFNTGVRKMRILWANDLNDKDIKKYKAYYRKYIKRLDIVSSAEEALMKLEANPDGYDIIFTDFIMDDEDTSMTGRDVADYVYNHNLNIPVILFSEIGYHPKRSFRQHFAGSLSAAENYYDEAFSYASNFLVARGKTKQSEQSITTETNTGHNNGLGQTVNQFLSKLPSWVLPAVGIGLLAFSAFNGFGNSAPFALAAALPFVSANINTQSNEEKPLNLKTDIAEVALTNRTNVVQLKDKDGNIGYYYKRANRGERDRTELFDIIITEKNLPGDNSLIGLEYPKVVSKNLSDLSEENAYYIKQNVNTEDPASKDIIMTAVNTSGYSIHKPKAEALKALKGKPITNEEWAQVVALFKTLNDNGFYHTDLLHNLFFRRDDNGKLIITVIDFDNWGNELDIKDLKMMARNLESIGAKEMSDADDEEEKDYIFRSFSLPFRNWLLPVMGIGLGVSLALSDLSSPGLALAALPLLASSFPIGDNSVINQISERPLNLKTDIVKAVPFEDRLVMELKDDGDNTRAYYKRTTQEEIDRTNEFGQIVTDNHLQQKYPLISIEYPKVLATDMSVLPKQVVIFIKSKFEDKDMQLNDLIMTAVNTSGWNRYDDPNTALIALKGKLITNEEWQQVVDFVKDFNDFGFYHTDLACNIFFRRDDSGKLIITIIDFENIGFRRGKDSSDLHFLNIIAKKLESAGAKEEDILAEKPLNLKTDIVKAKNVKAGRGTNVNAYAVWKLLDKFHRARAYLKLTTQNEIDRTILFDKIFRENALQNETSLIGFEYPKVISVTLSDLASNVIDKIQQETDQLSVYVRGGKERTQIPLITNAVNTSGFVLGNKIMERNMSITALEARFALKNKPITNEEWEEVVNLFQKLNEAGFIHGDLAHNLFFIRDDNDKLIISLIDFENNSNLFGPDTFYLQQMAFDLEAIGAKEKAPKDTPVTHNGNSSFKLPSWVLPAVGVGLLAFSAISGLSSPGLALATLPLLASTQPFKIQPSENLKSITKAVNVKPKRGLDVENYAVWALSDENGEPLYYLKYTTYEEKLRTDQFISIMDKNKLQDKYSIGIEFPRIVSTNLADLPKDISHFIQEDLANIYYGVRDSEDRIEIPLITTAINTSGFVLGSKIKRDPEDKSKILNIKSLRKEIMIALKDKPITQKEWQEVVNYFEDLDKAGFKHGDLAHNLFFRRDDDGKLIISLVDFEKEEISDDYYFSIIDIMTDAAFLDMMKEDFEQIGMVEKEDEAVLAKAKEESAAEINRDLAAWYFNMFNIDRNDLKSLILPAVGVGLLAFSALSGLGTPGLALATLPLLASTKLPDVKNTTQQKEDSHFANDVFALRKSVFRLAGFDNSFSGFLTEVPLFGVNKQVIVTAGHGVDRYPNKPITVFNHLGKKLTQADVLFYKHANDITKGSFEDYALLLPRERIEAEPLNLSFNGLSDYKNVATFSFPHKQFSYGVRTPIPLISKDSRKHISYNGIDFLGGGAVGGESGGAVVAETAPNQYSAVGTIITDYDNRATFVHSLGWLKNFLQGTLKIPNIINPKVPLTPFKYGTQFEIPFEGLDPSLLTPVSLENGKHQKDKTNGFNEVFNELKKSLVILQSPGSQGSGFITEIPFAGTKKQVIVTAGHLVSSAPDKPVAVFDSNNKFLTKADVAFYENIDVYGFFRGIQYDYALLLPQEKIDAPSLPLVLDRPFSDFKIFKSLSFPSKKFTHRNYKLIPGAQNFSLTPNIGFIDAKLRPGVSGGVVLVKTGRNEYSAIGTTIANYSNEITGEDIGLIHNLGWLKRFVETGKTEPKLIFPDFPKGPIFNIFNSIRRALHIIPTSQIIEQTQNITSANTPEVQADALSSLSNITKAELVEVEKDDVVKARAVWKLSDDDGNILGYLKYGNTQEIENTFLVDKVMKENNLKEKYPLLEIEYPEIITLGVTSLPDDVLQKVNEDFERIKKDVRDVNSRAQIGFILSPINSNGFFWAKRHLSPATALLARTKLNDEPITVEEWKQVNAFFSTLNQKGFVHEDLFNNLFFSRNAEGKLVLGLLDFESVRKSNNVEDLMTMKVFFEDIGAKEKGNKPKKVSAFDKILASLAETENVPSKNLMVGRQAVWRLKNTQGNIIAYLKYGTEEEIAKTRLLQKIISRNNFAKKYPLIDIEFPQIVAEKMRLPEQFQKNIDMELSGIRSALWGDDRGQIPFVMSPINTDGFTYYEALKASNKPIIKEKLLGKEITEEEWEQIREIFMELNDQGFVHPDLFNNSYIRRNENGKISLSMLDFEKTYQSVPENIFEIDLLGKALNKIGLIKAQGNYDSLLANVAQAKLVPVNDDIVEARAVWELKDKGGKTIGYLKYGMVEEINRTRLFHKIISDNNLQEKYPLIVIEYPQIIEEDIAFMDENIFKGVEDDFERIENDVRSASSRTQMYFAMTPVDASGFVVADNIWPSEEAGVLAAQKLNGKSITEEEWQQIADLFKELNNKGFVHEDLVNNMFFKRDKEGKLHISILDFEKVVDPINNDQNIRAMKNYFNGIKPYFMPKIFRDDQVRAKWVLSDWSGRLQPYIRWALSNTKGEIIGDITYSTAEKIESIKKLNEIITENNLREKFNNINIEYPQVLAEGAEGLSISAMLRIIRDMEFLNHNVTLGYFDENKDLVIMSPIDDNGFRWSDTKIDPRRQQGENFGHVYIDNKPITAAEWNSVFNFIVELNKNGFVCDNVYDNLVFKRNEKGKLILIVTDFGLGKGSNNIQDMQILGRMLYDIGMKEKNFFLDVLYSLQ